MESEGGQVVKEREVLQEGLDGLAPGRPGGVAGACVQAAAVSVAAGAG